MNGLTSRGCTVYRYSTRGSPAASSASSALPMAVHLPSPGLAERSNGGAKGAGTNTGGVVFAAGSFKGCFGSFVAGFSAAAGAAVGSSDAEGDAFSGIDEASLLATLGAVGLGAR